MIIKQYAVVSAETGKVFAKYLHKAGDVFKATIDISIEDYYEDHTTRSELATVRCHLSSSLGAIEKAKLLDVDSFITNVANSKFVFLSRNPDALIPTIIKG